MTLQPLVELYTAFLDIADHFAKYRVYFYFKKTDPIALLNFANRLSKIFYFKLDFFMLLILAKQVVLNQLMILFYR